MPALAGIHGLQSDGAEKNVAFRRTGSLCMKNKKIDKLILDAKLNLQQSKNAFKEKASELASLEESVGIRNAILAAASRDSWIFNSIRRDEASCAQIWSTDWNEKERLQSNDRQEDEKYMIKVRRKCYFSVDDLDLRLRLINFHCEIITSLTEKYRLEWVIEQLEAEKAKKSKVQEVTDILIPALTGFSCVYGLSSITAPEYRVVSAIAGAVSGYFLGKYTERYIAKKNEEQEHFFQNKIFEAEQKYIEHQNTPLCFSYYEQKTGKSMTDSGED